MKINNLKNKVMKTKIYFLQKAVFEDISWNTCLLCSIVQEGVRALPAHDDAQHLFLHDSLSKVVLKSESVDIHNPCLLSDIGHV